MPDTTPTAVAAPPTAQEALEALTKVDAGLQEFMPDSALSALLASMRLFIQSAAAEADAWAKIEAWLKADEGREFYWSYTMGKPRLVLDTPGAKERFTALRLAASWCEKEGAK